MRSALSVRNGKSMTLPDLLIEPLVRTALLVLRKDFAIEGDAFCSAVNFAISGVPALRETQNALNIASAQSSLSTCSCSRRV